MTWTNSAPLGDVLRHPVSDIRGEFLLSLLSLVNVLLGFKPMDFDSFEKALFGGWHSRDRACKGKHSTF